ncbi:TPA: glycosyltransferase family 2 protein, partial [Enterococcus faecium]|nr:glycosyltransferase family 2 protein [Enterococcus faecium]HBK6902844.1 glycosyltransferase family 2 protein [Enterococcus faecium]
MKHKVSVIVPIYNVEKYLRKCVDSLLSQTLKEIEIVLVDDGSPDASGEIADEYQKK